jgi:Uma2 family endonuclease
MATAVKAPPITVEQYKAFQGYPGLKDELIYGENVLSPRPKPLHQQALMNVMDLLRAALKTQDFTVQTNSNIDFGAEFSMPAPDVFVIAKPEWKRACDEDDYLRTAPVLVVEVLSPANTKQAAEKKGCSLPQQRCGGSLADSAEAAHAGARHAAQTCRGERNHCAALATGRQDIAG